MMEYGERYFMQKTGCFCKSILFFELFGEVDYFNALANLANSRSLAALVANDASLAIAALMLFLTNDSLLVRAPTIAIK
jgi:hypothetical protein